MCGGRDYSDTLCCTSEREAVTLSKLGDVWNVTAICGQTGKPI